VYDDCCHRGGAPFQKICLANARIAFIPEPDESSIAYLLRPERTAAERKGPYGGASAPDTNALFCVLFTAFEQRDFPNNLILYF
jgi:hypothetical protein